MSGRLLAYQLLERAMLDLDAAHDPRADEIRDIMDPIWRALTPEEIEFLDARNPAPQSGSVPELACARVQHAGERWYRCALTTPHDTPHFCRETGKTWGAGRDCGCNVLAPIEGATISCGQQLGHQGPHVGVCTSKQDGIPRSYRVSGLERVTISWAWEETAS